MGHPAFSALADIPHPAADLGDLGLGAAGEVICNLLDTGVAGNADSFAAYRGGASVAVRISVQPLQEHPGSAPASGKAQGSRRSVVVVRERSEELRAEEHLRVSEEQFRVLAEQAPIGIFRSDVGLRLGYANARCIEILGVSTTGLHGSRWLDTLAPADRARVVTALEGVLEGAEAEVDQVKVERPDGSARWVSIRVAPVLSSHRAGGFVGSVEDVTERRLLEQALSYDATHDRLTGLPNRSLLWEVLRDQLDRPEPAVAVLFVDLDDFKFVNDSFGHETGDELLLAVADRLTDAVRPHDLVTRFGGDEFVVVCAEVRDADQAERIARRLVDSLAPPFTIAGREINVSASMGLVLSTEPGLDPETVLRDADTALYQAKASGKARWALFDERVRQGVTTRLAMANALRRAIEHDAAHRALPADRRPAHRPGGGRGSAVALVRPRVRPRLPGGVRGPGGGDGHHRPARRVGPAGVVPAARAVAGRPRRPRPRLPQRQPVGPPAGRPGHGRDGHAHPARRPAWRREDCASS